MRTNVLHRLTYVFHQPHTKNQRVIPGASKANESDSIPLKIVKKKQDKINRLRVSEKKKNNQLVGRFKNKYTCYVFEHKHKKRDGFV